MTKEITVTTSLLKSIVFNDLPRHDTCWSMISGLDGRLYIGICGEMTGGLSACVARYDPTRDQVTYLLDVAEVLGVPNDANQAAHAKVHYSLVQDDDGIMYAATHCTGAPKGDFVWRPWNCWTHPHKKFSGSGLIAFRPDNGEVLFTDIFLPQEGSRCLAIAPKHRKLYGISYPRNHFFIYDLEKRSLRDLGRIGSINPQCIFTDNHENAYTTDDYGYLIKCDADTEELTTLEIQIPHAAFRDGFHNVLYDVTPSPDGESVFGVMWNFGTRLFRYDCVHNKLYDFGKAYGEESREWSHLIHSHTGGLVFGPDQNLYFASNFVTDGKNVPHLIKMDPETGKREIIDIISENGVPADHISRAAADFQGNLYFAEVGNTPTKIFQYTPEQTSNQNSFTPARRFWG
jgi:hypothetical protein